MSFLGLTRALRQWCKEGASQLLPETDHMVFLLVDGLGAHWLTSHGQGSFLGRHQSATLRSVYPSTTTVALTTLATAEPPSKHGLSGWWGYLPDRDLSVTPLPFTHRFGGRPLDFPREVLWPFTPWMKEVEISLLALQPEAFWNSIFSRYLRGEKNGAGYRELEDCVEMVGLHVDSHSRSFSFVYWPEFDTACHLHGCTSAQVKEVFTRIDRAAQQLRDRISGKARLVVTADHGLIDVERRLLIHQGDPLLDLLLAPPSGEPRNPVFHLIPGCRERFCHDFTRRFGEHFTLRPSEEMLEGELSEQARRFYGDLIGVARTPAALHYRVPGAPRGPEFIGYHGGTTAEETTIPLIVC